MYVPTIIFRKTLYVLGAHICVHTLVIDTVLDLASCHFHHGGDVFIRQGHAKVDHRTAQFYWVDVTIAIFIKHLIKAKT